jgi:methionyl-tRNA formyltransferase
MKISILTDEKSWFNRYVNELKHLLKERGHVVDMTHDAHNITNGEVCFLLGVYSLVKQDILSRNHHNLVIHASDLPLGKGWAPLAWQVLEGKNEIPVCLFEATEQVDAGDIYIKSFIKLEGHELCDEIRFKQAQNMIELCLKFVDDYPQILQLAISQTGEETFYPRRTSDSSELDINKSIKEQFNLLRIADNNDYPAFFYHEGYKYTLKMEKSK